MVQQTRSNNRILLCTIILLAFGLRLYHLDVQSLWYDEGVTAQVAQFGISELTRWTAGDIQPPLYYYFIAGWGRLAGWSEWSLRFLSLFFGTLTVPIMAALALLLTKRRAAGLLAALFTALHPLLLYYSQEARMYTMLVALCTLAAYCLIRSSWASKRNPYLWAAYIISATAAIYTHYFAFFILLALGLAFLLNQLLILRTSDKEPRIPPYTGYRLSVVSQPYPNIHPKLPAPHFLLSNLIILLLYLPWFTHLFTRLSMDSSYWQGRFKQWEALRHILISFTSGETILEAEATQHLILYGIVTLVALVGLFWRYSGKVQTCQYLLLWMSAPIIAVLILASLVPKFNARYVMIALPGLILLWSIGLSAFFEKRKQRFAWGFPLIGLLCTATLSTGFINADYNWFHNPAFTKAQWRELSDYIRSQKSEGEAVVLVSGHTWPIWQYYAPDMPAVRLPEIDILDVNAVLDFDTTAEVLRQELPRRSGVWFVGWQDDIIDPMQVAPLQFQIAGDESPVEAQFWHLDLHHYTNVNSTDFIANEPAKTATDINFGNLIHLVGHLIAPNGDLLLFWERHPDQSPSEAGGADEQPIDLHITGQTFTADDLPYAKLQDQRPASYNYPSFRWQPAQVTVGRIPMAEWAGEDALPSTYQLSLGVYDANGDYAGLDIMGEQIEGELPELLGKRTTLELVLPEIEKELDEAISARHGSTLLPGLSASLSPQMDTAEPAEPFLLEINWSIKDKIEQAYELQSRWINRATGKVVSEQLQPFASANPTNRWPANRQIRTVHELYPPLGLRAGDYWLSVGLSNPESGFAHVPFTVLPSTRIFKPPRFNTSVETTWGDQLNLLGVIEPIREQMYAEQVLVLTLVWQALRKPQADYSVTVQWLNAENRPVGQADLGLPSGTTYWLPRQVELQTILTRTPEQPDDYKLMVAVYDANQETFPRLTTANGEDMIELGSVTILPIE